MLASTFERGANDGSYWLVDDGHGRLPVYLSPARTPRRQPLSSSRLTPTSPRAPMPRSAYGASPLADRAAVRPIG
jgi:hypothetical protein